MSARSIVGAAVNPNEERDEKLASLILSRDVERIAWGAELACAIGETALFDKMLRGVTWAPPAHPHGYGTLRVRGFCARSNTRRRWDLVRAFALLAGAPRECEAASKVLASATSLDVDRSIPPIPEDGCDLAPLSAFTKLRRLRVKSSTAPMNLGALAGLPALEELVIEAPLSELASLSGAPSLKSLTVDSSALLAIDGLRDLPSLRELELCGCPRLRTFEFVRALPTLTTLSLLHSGGAKVDLSPLTALPSLVDLSLTLLGESLDGIASIAAISSLQTLAIEGLSGVRSLAPLRALPRLCGLHWSGGELASLDLDGAPALRDVSIARTAGDVTRDLEVFRGLDLRTLRLDSEVGCHDLSALSASNELTELSLRAPRLRTLDGVSLASLTRCEIERGDLDDVSALATATGLRWLSLRGCARVRDVSALDALPQLRGVILTGTAVTPESLPPRLRAIAVLVGDESLSAMVSKVDAIDEPTPRGLSEAARVEWPRVIALLRSYDARTVERGVALVRAIGDVTLYHALLRGAQWRRRHLDPEHGFIALRDSRLRVSGRDADDLMRVALTLTAEAPDACRSAWALRQRVTGLRLARPGNGARDVDAAPLGAFTNLRALALDDVATLRNGAALDALVNLDSLSIRGRTVPVDFDLARMVKLRVCTIYGARSGAVTHMLRAPALRELAVMYSTHEPRGEAIVIEGHPTLKRVSVRVSSAQGEATIRSCPALEEIYVSWASTVRRLDIRGCVALRRLTIESYSSARLVEALGLEELVALESLECDEGFASAVVSRAPHIASRVERLTLKAWPHRACELVAAFHGLRELRFRWASSLVDVSALASLSRLASIELMCCSKLTRLDALAELPLTRLELYSTPVDRASLPPSLARLLR